MFNSLRFRLSVCHPLQDVRTKIQKLLYTLDIKLDSVISHLCLWLQQSWLLYLKLNSTIAKDCHIGIITFLIRPAYRLVEPWNQLPWESLSHGLPHFSFVFIMNSLVFVTFLLFRWQNCKQIKGLSSRILLFEFVIHTYHIHDQRLVMTRPVPLEFFINKFPLWDGAGLWPIKVSQACPTG